MEQNGRLLRGRLHRGHRVEDTGLRDEDNRVEVNRKGIGTERGHKRG